MFKNIPRGEKIRLSLRTSDIAQLLNLTPATVRQYIRKGKLSFTGDSIEDFKMLADLFFSQ